MTNNALLELINILTVNGITMSLENDLPFEEAVLKLADNCNWKYFQFHRSHISKYEELLERYKEKINWTNVCQYWSSRMSLSTLFKYKDYIDFPEYFTHRALSLTEEEAEVLFAHGIMIAEFHSPYSLPMRYVVIDLGQYNKQYHQIKYNFTIDDTISVNTCCLFKSQYGYSVKEIDPSGKYFKIYV